MAKSDNCNFVKPPRIFRKSSNSAQSSKIGFRPFPENPPDARKVRWYPSSDQTRMSAISRIFLYVKYFLLGKKIVRVAIFDSYQDIADVRLIEQPRVPCFAFGCNASKIVVFFKTDGGVTSLTMDAGNDVTWSNKQLVGWFSF